MSGLKLLLRAINTCRFLLVATIINSTSGHQKEGATLVRCTWSLLKVTHCQDFWAIEYILINRRQTDDKKGKYFAFQIRAYYCRPKAFKPIKFPKFSKMLQRTSRIIKKIHTISERRWKIDDIYQITDYRVCRPFVSV